MVISSPPLNKKTFTHGFTKKETESQNREAQTPEADEGKPPQEAFALQELAATFRGMISLRFARPRKFAGALSVAIIGGLAAPIFSAPEAPPAQPVAAPQVKAARRAAPKKPASEDTPPPAARPAGPEEFADAFPTNVPAAADLELHPDAARKADALVAFTEALIAEDGADTEKSLAGYRKVLELDPGYAELAVKVAYELSRRNDVSAGIQVLKDCIKAAPKEPMPLIFLSQLYSRQLKKPDLALKAAEQALAVAPENFATYLAIFELAVAGGDTKKAEAVLEKASKSGSRDDFNCTVGLNMPPR